MRSRIRSIRFRARGLASPSESSAGARPERPAKRSTMPRSLAARSSERQYGRASRPSSDTTLRRRTARSAAVRMRTGFSASQCRARSLPTTRCRYPCSQPAYALPGGDAAVRHHRGAARGTGGVGHPRRGAVFAHVAGEHLRAAHEAADAGHRSQSGQRAVGALVLGVSAPGLRLPLRPAPGTGVGQVVRGDGPLRAEQPHRAVEEVAPDRPAVGHRGIGRAVRTHWSHGSEVGARQFAQGAALGRRRVARSEPGHAMRAMIGPTAAACNDGAMPGRPGRSGSAGFPMAHSPAGSTPTERGRSTSREAARTCWRSGLRSGGADAVPGGQRGGDALRVRLRLRGTGAASPMRSERTRRKVNYPPSARARRMNMTPRWRGARQYARYKVVYGTTFLSPTVDQAFPSENPRKSAKSGRIPRQFRLLVVKMGYGT